MARRAWRWLTGLMVIGLFVSGLSFTTALPSAAMPRLPDPGASSQGPAPVTDPTYKPADCASLTAAERSAEVPVARCFAVGLATATGRTLQDVPAPPITAVSPGQLQQAYNLPDGGEGMTVAIVDAYGYSKAESDLAVYRSYFGLPACTTANGCFTKIDQRGGTDYPPDDGGWSVETALDLDAVSSVCPKCNILLVQGDSAGLDDLGAAVNTAAGTPGVVAISNSYGLDGEASGVTAFDRYYDHPGIAITVSSGDTGNVQSWPATNPNVTAVGGTKLTKDSSTARGWTESAWGTVRGGPGGGSGCSLYEPSPEWQRDVGTSCGARKATADISADADPATGIGVYNTVGQSGWSQYGGTSLAAPLVAGMYALAGTPTPGTYPASYPYAAQGRFTDVTEGTNGPCGDKVCEAGPGWDGPTGLGTPYGVAGLTQGETGAVVGTVTDAANGRPLAGVTLRARAADGSVFTATTGTDGRYELHAPAGGYELVASTFGYESRTATGIEVAVDKKVTSDFALTRIATRTVSGNVTDASGHGWPMRARITVDGHPDDAVYSDPYTGRYSLALPTGSTYTLHATAVDLAGYTTADVPVDLTKGTGTATAHIGLGIDEKTCYATGYGWAYDGTGADFEGWTGKTPRKGWTVTDAKDNGQTWAFEDPGKAGNHTGGSGNFAIVDSDYYKTGAGQDTSLVSPVIDLGAVDSPIIGFDTDYNGVGGQTGMIDYTVDGGRTWTNLWKKTSITSVRGHVDLPVPEAAGQKQVQVRFHFTGYAGAWWELDNIAIGRGRTCAVTPGALVAGVVRDQNTGLPLTGATVTSNTHSDEFGVTTATPEDPGLPDGYYSFFTTRTGKGGFTAADGRYTPSEADLTIAADEVTKHQFKLAAGHLTVSSADLRLSGRIGRTTTPKSLTSTVTFGNDGTEPVHVALTESQGGSTPTAGTNSGKGAPKTVLPARTSYAGPKSAPTAARKARPAQQQTPAAEPWTPMADYPRPVMDDAVASHGGKVYVIGGSSGSATYADVSVYDTAGGSWTAAADLPEPLNGASAGFIGNTLYVAGGWNASGGTSKHTYAYHPADDTWTRVADMPAGLSAAGTAVLAGKLYVIGGCTTGGCTPTSKAVYGYDPDEDSWTAGPAYPSPVAFTACGGIGGEVVCAGGVNADADKPATATYAWVPGTETWTARAALPVDAWGAASAVANGRLHVMGGAVDDGKSVTNQGFSYDTATDRWTALPNSNNSLYRGGAACGIHKIGGTTGGFTPVAYGESLPGYDQCGGDVVWLAEDDTEFDVAPGATVTVRVTGDTTGFTQPGDFAAALDIATDTPYAADGVAVKLHVDPPVSWGKITGTVADSGGTPVGGAVVQICGQWTQRSGCGPVTYTLRTDAAGHYRLWLDKSLNSLAVQVAKDGFAPQFRIVKIKKGATTTADFGLEKL
ncbi:carboxypeptidase regulatory-like domain-containing protein [Streptomyces sp. NBC_00441]|uniref:carboxypeptidase regulatory-like domain-containing protein n=1 Tax=Streptomyces sp. NBC_00441 TaxID=2975742 RepID=UPI002E28817B|nr:carboxypeptidase regulatory-like domain-containing protein [Streptomyces sp. NBC_00441]